MADLKVEVTFPNGATVTYHGDDARNVVNYLCLDEDSYLPGEMVDITTQHPPFLSPEADDPKEETDGQN